VTSWKREEDGRKKEGGQWYEVELRGKRRDRTVAISSAKETNTRIT